MQRRRRRRSDSFVQTFAGEYKLMKLDEVYGRKLGEGSSEKSVTRRVQKVSRPTAKDPKVASATWTRHYY